MSLSLPEPYVGLDAFNELAVREHADQVQRNFEKIRGQWFSSQPSGWQALSYSNGWRSWNGGAAAPWGTAGYRKDLAGNVHLSGLLDKNGGNWVANELMFTLPAGYRPHQQVMFSPRMQSGGVEVNGRCDITTAGAFTLVLFGGLANPVGTVAIHGICFPAGN